MNELLKVNDTDTWMVKGIDTTTLVNFINKLYKGNYILARTDNPNKFVLMSPLGAGLQGHFSLYIFTHSNGSFTFVIYEIYDAELVDEFVKDIETALPHVKTVIAIGDEFRGFDLRIDVDKILITKLIERINNL